MELAVQSVDQLALSTEVTATAGKKAKSISKVSKVPRIRRVINFAINHLPHALNMAYCILYSTRPRAQSALRSRAVNAIRH